MNIIGTQLNTEISTYYETNYKFIEPNKKKKKNYL